MVWKPTYEELEQRVKELEKEALELRQTEEALRESAHRLEIAYDQSIMYAQQLNEEIAKRKQEEEKLQETRDYLENLFNYANAPIIVWDPAFRITRFNHAFERLTGKSADEVVGASLDILFPEDRRQEAMAYIRRTGEGERWEVVEIPILGPDGTVRIVLWNSANIYAEDGTTVIATIAQGQDITDRKRAEEALRKSEQEKEAVLNSMSEAVVYQDAEYRVVWANQAAGESVGMAPEKLVGRHCYEIWHGRSKPCVSCPGVKVRETGQPQELEMTSSDGREWFMRAYPVRDANGDIAGVVEFTLEITERKRAEKAIRESEEKFKAITGSAKDAIIMMDNKGNISYWNEAAEQIFGYSAHEALGKELHIFLAPQEYHDAYRQGILTFNKTGQGSAVGKTLELEAVRKDGAIFPIELSVSAVEIEENWHATGIVRDITARKLAEEELRRVNEELRDFAYVVSHDLKTPITFIQGFSSFLLENYQEKLEERGRTCLERIEANAWRMGALVTDLLALSKIGKVVSTFGDVSSVELVRNATSGLQDRLKANGIECVVTNDLPTIHCDGERIYQVFENLLVNAIKYMGDTKRPNIEIGYEDRAGFHEFYVRDNGIGIDPKYHRKIFEKFHRLKEKEDEEGTGLGLAIVERIVNNHGGMVWVKSEKGKGATFYFTLPKAS